MIKKTICLIILLLVCTSCTQKVVLDDKASQDTASVAENTAIETPPKSEEAAPEPSKKDNLEIASTLLDGYMKKVLNPPKINSPEFKFAEVQNVKMVAPVTGEYFVNKTKTNYDVYGTDLGVPLIKKF